MNKVKNFETFKKKSIPYYDEMGDSFFCKIIEMAKERNMSLVGYLFYKVKISLLQALAKNCPINSLRILFQRWRGVHIGKNVYLGKNVFIDNLYPNFIYLDEDVTISTDCMIIAHFNPRIRFRNLFEAKASPVIIKAGAFLGIRVVIMPEVIIGESAVVTTGSIVMRNVAPYTMVQGNPAKRILKFEHLMVNQIINT